MYTHSYIYTCIRGLFNKYGEFCQRSRHKRTLYTLSHTHTHIHIYTCVDYSIKYFFLPKQ